MNLRLAEASDLAALVAIDPLAQRAPTRRALLRSALECRSCWLAEEAGRVVGYAILDYTFYGNGFVSVLWVHETARRRGVGAALLNQAARVCTMPKLFTSTNLSNLPMQSLLAKLGFQLSGVIHNLDPGDPELVYFRSVRE